MSRKYVSITISLLMLLALLPATFAESDTQHLVILTVSQPVAVPGVLLQPGKYSLRFLDNNQRTVLLRAANGETVGLYSVIDAYRTAPTKNVEVLVQHVAGSARITSWFLPGSTMGWEFSYGGKNVSPMAQTANPSVVAGN